MAVAVVDVAVVGAGLAGLTAAEALHQRGLQVQVVEARPRVGGRLLTLRPDTETGPPPAFDLGATWLWSDQPRIQALAARLGLRVFRQFHDGRTLQEAPGAEPLEVEPPPEPAAYLRVVGGTQQLCERLAERLPGGSVSLDTTVTGVAVEGDRLAVSTVGPGGWEERLRPRSVVVALPPRLALQRISFDPPLPDDLAQVMRRTRTWMGTALKCVVVYESNFWRKAGLSGSAFSTAGPLYEVHDAGDEEGSVAALWGFLSPLHRFRDMAPDERVPLVFEQLGRLFGPQATDPTGYFERDWSTDPNTNDVTPDLGEAEAPYGHALLAQPLLDGRLVWAGTETAGEGGGHMEGAVASGLRAAERVTAAARGR